VVFLPHLLELAKLVKVQFPFSQVQSTTRRVTQLHWIHRLLHLEMFSLHQIIYTVCDISLSDISGNTERNASAQCREDCEYDNKNISVDRSLRTVKKKRPSATSEQPGFLLQLRERQVLDMFMLL
jgi:hypothetical protein